MARAWRAIHIRLRRWRRVPSSSNPSIARSARARYPVRWRRKHRLKGLVAARSSSLMLVCEAFQFIYASKPVVCLRDGLTVVGLRKGRTESSKSEALSPSRCARVDAFLMAFCAVLAVAEVHICSCKAAEQLATRSSDRSVSILPIASLRRCERFGDRLRWKGTGRHQNRA